MRGAAAGAARRLKGVFFQMVAYGGVGACAAAVNIGLFWALNGSLGVDERPATVASTFVGACVNFAIGRLTLFKAQARKGKGAWRDFGGVLAGSAVGNALDLALMWLLVTSLKAPAMPAKLLVTGVVFLWNFTAQRYIVYRIKGAKA